MERRYSTEYGMSDESVSRTQVFEQKPFKPTTLMDDDPNAQAMTQLANHLSQLIVGDKAQKAEADDSMADDIKKQGRRYVLKWLGGAITGVLAIIGGAYQYGGPADATEKAEAVTHEADEKIHELDETKAELKALQEDIETKRQERVAGRLSGVEELASANSGAMAGTDSKVDAILDEVLTKDDAKEAKLAAEKRAKAAESMAKAGLKKNAMAED